MMELLLSLLMLHEAGTEHEMVLANPKTITPHTKFECRVCVLGQRRIRTMMSSMIPRHSLPPPGALA